MNAERDFHPGMITEAAFKLAVVAALDLDPDQFQIGSECDVVSERGDWKRIDILCLCKRGQIVIELKQFPAAFCFPPPLPSLSSFPSSSPSCSRARPNLSKPSAHSTSALPTGPTVPTASTLSPPPTVAPPFPPLEKRPATWKERNIQTAIVVCRSRDATEEEVGRWEVQLYSEVEGRAKTRKVVRPYSREISDDQLRPYGHALMHMSQYSRSNPMIARVRRDHPTILVALVLVASTIFTHCIPLSS